MIEISQIVAATDEKISAFAAFADDANARPNASTNIGEPIGCKTELGAGNIYFIWHLWISYATAKQKSRTPYLSR